MRVSVRCVVIHPHAAHALVEMTGLNNVGVCCRSKSRTFPVANTVSRTHDRSARSPANSGRTVERGIIIPIVSILGYSAPVNHARSHVLDSTVQGVVENVGVINLASVIPCGSRNFSRATAPASVSYSVLLGFNFSDVGASHDVVKKQSPTSTMRNPEVARSVR